MEFYKQDVAAGGSDFLTVALWDYREIAYAEGGDDYQTGSPAADPGNGNFWGYNNQFRSIADAIVTLKTDFDALDAIVGDVTAAEMDQIENIEGTNISAAQWAYVGALDQSLAVADDVQFAKVTTESLDSVGGEINLNNNEFTNAGQFHSEVTTGTEPFEIQSTTKVTNLHADQVDGCDVIDEDAMGSDSDVHVPTQQSVKAYVDAEVAGVGGGVVALSAFIAGNAYVADNIVWVRAPKAFTLSKMRIGAGTAPTGSALTISSDYHATDPDSATTIFTTGPETEAPSIAAAGHTDDSGTPDVTAIAAGGWLSLNIDAIGSTIPGADIFVEWIAA